MRLGFDIDGVLADFNTAFIQRVKQITGRDLFAAGYVPTTWNYPESLGYTREEVGKVWAALKTDRTFWLTLPPYVGAMDQIARIRGLAEAGHDVYFVTSRPGEQAKHQTEVWLATHSGDFGWNPTVLISGEKGLVAQALQLDAYIDDRDMNCHDVIVQTWGTPRTGPTTHTYLLDRPWNQGAVLDLDWAARIESVDDMLDRYEALREAREAA